MKFFSFSSKYFDLWIISDDESIDMNRHSSFSSSSKASMIESLKNRIRELKRLKSLYHIIEQQRKISILISKKLRSLRFSTKLRFLTESSKKNEEKIKINFFSIYSLSIDVKLWILKIQNFFYLQNISNSLLQITCVISYFNDILKRRIQRLRLAENIRFFSNWQNLQLWLTINYDRQLAKLNADLAMKKIKMKEKERVHDFINKFKTIVTNLKWNESAICSTFRKKLNRDIFDTVYLLHSKNWSKTFAVFKALTHDAESHLRIEKRAYEKIYNNSTNDYQRRKRIRFSNESEDSRKNRNKSKIWSNRHQKNYAIKKERRKKKENNLCLNCDEKNHWAKNSKCSNKSKLRKFNNSKKEQRFQSARI